MNDPDLRALETSLADLHPAQPSWERDRLLFQMGQASARGDRRWRLATAASALLAACLACILVARSLQPPPVRIVHVPTPAPAVQDKTPREELVIQEEPTPFVRYVRLRDEVVRHGLDGLPELPEPAEGPPPLPEDRLYPF
jgi:hypothetical protein